MIIVRRILLYLYLFIITHIHTHRKHSVWYGEIGIFKFYDLNLGASLTPQLLKNLSAMQETQFDSWVRKIHWRRVGRWGVPSLGQEDPLEKVRATHSSILAWRIPWSVYIVHGVAKSWTRLSDFHFTSYLLLPNKLL